MADFKQFLVQTLAKQSPSLEEGFFLVKLWRNWDSVLGDLSTYLYPINRKGDVLLLGAKDPLILQEGHFLAEEILTKVNAFLGKPFFKQVKFTLVESDQGLHKVKL